MGIFSTMLIFTLLLLLTSQVYPKILVELHPSLDRNGVIPCQEENLLNCVLAKVDVSAFDDEVLLLPNGVELTKTNYIQKPADRSGMADEVTSVTYSAGG